jgi:predicted alpha/beta hydrolase family esterase
METILIVPGLNDSGPQHWQSWFESAVPNCTRVKQPDWATPHLPRWGQTVADAVRRAKPPVWIVAHSFGCLAAVWAGTRRNADIAGALLVAPADPVHFGASFALPRGPLPFKALLIASENDEWMSLESARGWARAWVATLINAGAAGHINAESGFGPWPEGIGHFRALRAAAQTRASAPLHEREYR